MSGRTTPGPGVPEGLSRDTFSQFAEPYRQELKLHCYRMLGSLQDAEDVVQETFVKAWNALDEFEGRALFRNWLYRIATNACLNALTSRSRRGRLLPRVRQVDGGDHPPHALRRRVACRQPNCPSSVGVGRADERWRARRAARASRDRHASACRSLTRSVSRSCHNAGCTMPSRVWASVLAVHLRGSC